MTIDKRNWTEEELVGYGDNVWYAANHYMKENVRLCSFGEIESYISSVIPEFAMDSPYEKQACLNEILCDMVDEGVAVRIEFADYDAYILTGYFWERWER